MKNKERNESAKESRDETEDHYSIFLSFGLNTKHILFYPCLMCGCYDGRHVCGHFNGFLFLILFTQRCDMNQELLSSHFLRIL